jgi:hypothetical protein
MRVILHSGHSGVDVPDPSRAAMQAVYGMPVVELLIHAADESVAPTDRTAGLVLLASGRYTENDVSIDELLEQGRMLRGFWVGLAQLPMSHPFTVRRLERLFRVGLLTAVPPAARPSGGNRDQPFRP